jgi:hypothetical protein
MNKLLVIALLATAGLAGCATRPGPVADAAQAQMDCSATRASPAQRWRAVPARSCAAQGEAR